MSRTTDTLAATWTNRANEYEQTADELRAVAETARAENRPGEYWDMKIAAAFNQGQADAHRACARQLVQAVI